MERSEKAPPSISGTLVVMVPSSSGLVVAADSRATVLGISCDQQVKIFEPSHPKRTIATVTGTGIILDTPGHPVPLKDICEHVRNGTRLLDIERVLLDGLQQSAVETLSAVDVTALAEQCIQAVRSAKARDVTAFAAYRNREMLNVILATYDPTGQVSIVRGFVIGLTQQLEPVLVHTFEGQIGPESNRDYWAFGETDYLNAVVLAGAGRQYLSEATLRFYNTARHVRDITVQEAEAFAVDLIEAAARTTALVPAPSGIGGPVDVVLVGANPEPERRRWKSP